MFTKGARVKNIHTGDIFTVKKCYWQQYADTGDYTVEFEPSFSNGQWQETPWNKGSNLLLAEKEE